MTSNANPTKTNLPILNETPDEVSETHDSETTTIENHATPTTAKQNAREHELIQEAKGYRKRAQDAEKANEILKAEIQTLKDRNRELLVSIALPAIHQHGGPGAALITARTLSAVDCDLESIVKDGAVDTMKARDVAKDVLEKLGLDLAPLMPKLKGKEVGAGSIREQSTWKNALTDKN